MRSLSSRLQREGKTRSLCRIWRPSFVDGRILESELMYGTFPMARVEQAFFPCYKLHVVRCIDKCCMESSLNVVCLILICTCFDHSSFSRNQNKVSSIADSQKPLAPKIQKLCSTNGYYTAPRSAARQSLVPPVQNERKMSTDIICVHMINMYISGPVFL